MICSMDVTPEIMTTQHYILGRLEQKKRGWPTSKYQESGETSVFPKLNIRIEPVTDHYCSLWVEAVSVKNALE